MEKTGFVYIWYDRKHKRYYIGCHWGSETDGYICSSNWMRDSYKRRPEDFKRRILKRNISSREQMYVEEQKYLNMIKPEEVKDRYYNLHITNNETWLKYPESIKTVGEKISFSKKGKSVPAPAGRGEAISKAKKGKALTEKHKESLRGIKKPEHTEQWKEESSKRMKEQWASDSPRRQAVSLASKKRWEEFRKNKQLQIG